MTWVLILVMVMPGQPAQPPVIVGHMRDEASCTVAGGGMALVVGWRCEPMAEAGA